jgi:hypothetical protein
MAVAITCKLYHYNTQLLVDKEFINNVEASKYKLETIDGIKVKTLKMKSRYSKQLDL